MYNGSIQQNTNIGSDYGLVQCEQQAMVWTNGDLFIDACMRHSTPMS